jgi:hypothetical protein
MEFNYNKAELIAQLESLKNTDIEAFTNLILECFEMEPDTVIFDPAPVETKLRALNSMLKYLETTERFEDCMFVKKLIDRIEDEQ